MRPGPMSASFTNLCTTRITCVVNKQTIVT